MSGLCGQKSYWLGCRRAGLAGCPWFRKLWPYYDDLMAELLVHRRVYSAILLWLGRTAGDRAAAQFVMRLEQRRRQHRGSHFDHRFCEDRVKRYSMYNYSAMLLREPILRQVVSARGRLYVSIGSFRKENDRWMKYQVGRSVQYAARHRTICGCINCLARDVEVSVRLVESVVLFSGKKCWNIIALYAVGPYP